MCGRYSFVPTRQQLETDLAGIELPAQLQIRFNIAPAEWVYVLANDNPQVLQSMVWGLVPHWDKVGAPNGKMINARSEGIAEKPSFRDPVRRRRCLVPADSFYEWRNAPARKKIPYRIHASDGHLLMMAGIWDEWGTGAHQFRSFSIVTTVPNREVAALHDRMPVILTKADQGRWLEDIPLESVLELLHPPADNTLLLYRVSEKLNAAGYEGTDLHTPVPETPTLF
jgi:putative SOS response-associated peptidase YedK